MSGKEARKTQASRGGDRGAGRTERPFRPRARSRLPPTYVVYVSCAVKHT